MNSSNSTSGLTDEKLQNQQRSTPAFRRCPSCNHELHCNPNMVGFPGGVKFDPSDQELIEHLESLVKEGGSRAHPLIGEFIPTLQGNDGICYTHPENLPGVTRDGVSKHFFHRPSKAYTSGTRKRRKVQSERGLRSCDDDVGEARWHKTGKTRPVIVGGRQKGCKKILVLYTTYGKQGKPEKTNWVIHQYHLGREEEKDGELVVSKVFYQQTQRRSTATKKDEKVEVTSESTEAEDMLPAAATEAAVAMIQLQKHLQQRQAATSPPTMSHEVGVGDPALAGDQGLLHETHHIPSQHKVQSVLVKPVHTMSFVESKPLNTELTKLTLAVQSSAFLNNGEKQEDQKQQKKVDCRRPCTSEEAMIASQSQTTSTEEDVQEASTQPKEIQRRPYQHWPPDHHQYG